MTQKHSPEPWEIDDKHVRQEGGGDVAICHVLSIDSDIEGDWVRGPITEANARRIVACVNAMAGIGEDNALFFKGNSVRSVISNMKLKESELKQQRDELLAALEAFTSAQDAKRSASGNGAGPIAAAIGNLVIAEERARAAIKKITGETK